MSTTTDTTPTGPPSGGTGTGANAPGGTGSGAPDPNVPQGTGTGAESAGERTDAPGAGERTGDRENDDQGGNGEAARHRRRAREAEAERDTLRERVTRMQTAEVTRLAGETLAAPGDLLALGASLPDLLDPESGDVDAERVRAACAALVESRPGLRRPPFDRGSIGQGRPAESKPTPPAATWGDVLRGPQA